MRFVLFISLGFLLGCDVFGQSFSLDQLIKMSSMDIDQFDTFVSLNGYKFSYKKDDTNVTKFFYEYPKNENTILIGGEMVVFYANNSKNKRAISYVTHNSKEYVKLKNRVKILGFKLDDTETVKLPNGLFSNIFNYSKGKEHITIFADQTYTIFYDLDF